jgi:N-acetylglutamate synthase-like GNAT family acetyltransferase
VIELVFRGLHHFGRVCGSSSEGARTIERDGVIAAIVPSAPERSVVNSTVCLSGQALREAYDEIAAAYEEIGATWTVWLRQEDDATAAFLEDRGHALDAQPMGMVHTDLAGVERPGPDELTAWTRDGDVEVVGPLNDRAYDFGTDSFTRAMRRMPAGLSRVYVASDDGTAVACLLMTDDDGGNTDLECVAVVPEARGRGISGKLLRHALADAAERGLETSTLVATRLGYPVYERVGYQAIEPVSMWQRDAAV